jgi:hypothetical protein
MGALFLEHRLNLATGAAVDPSGRPVRFPLIKEGVLLLDRFESSPLQGRALSVLDCVLDGALAIRIPYAGWVRHHAVVSEHGGIHRIELRLVQVRFDYAFLQIVENDVLRDATKVAPGLLVQFSPDLFAGLPHDAAEAAPRVTQRHHEQPGLAVSVGARHPGQGAFAIVNLRLFARHEVQPVELGRLALTHCPHEPLDAVVSSDKAKSVHQILVDGHGIAPKPQLSLYEPPVRLAS